MGRTVGRTRGEEQRNIARMIEEMQGRYTVWDIWQDFIACTAISLANAFDGPESELREKEYNDRMGKYEEKERKLFSQMLCELVEGLERNPEQDFLGDMFMALECGDKWKGQFFTPYNLCSLVASMSYNEEIKNRIQEEGWIKAGDCACGAGALLVAFANVCRGHGINYQESVLFVGQDIDRLAGMMCFIQLSLLGCAGYVCIGDSIGKPVCSMDKRGLIPEGGREIWKTPMYHADLWKERKMITIMDLAVRKPSEKENC